MSNDNDIDFINGERRHLGKIYTDVAYAISEVPPSFLKKN